MSNTVLKKVLDGNSNFRGLQQRHYLSADFLFLAMHYYVVTNTDIFYDPGKDLFWVKHPDGWQVALWLM